MQHTPLYTVIIPHRNTPELLRRCLASIPDTDAIQVIVVDDNSSADIVDFTRFPGCERKHTQVIFCKESRGAGHARNLALPQAQGEWLIFADADDYFTPDAWSTIAAYATHPADIVYWGIRSVDSDTGLTLHDRGDEFIKDLHNYLLTKDREWECRLRFWSVMPWGKMIRRQTVEQHAIRFSETLYSNDVLFCTRLALLAQQIEATEAVCYCVTRHSGSLTQTRSLDAIRTRYEINLQKNLLLRRHGYRRYEANVLMFMRLLMRFGVKGLWTFIRLSCTYRASLLPSWHWMRTIRRENKALSQPR